MPKHQKPDTKLYDEACRIVGQCCLALAENGAETHRDQLVHQLKRLSWLYMQETNETNLAMLFAIEQLATSEDWKKPYLGEDQNKG